MKRMNLMVCAAMVCVLPWCNEAAAGERVALALSGPDCDGSRQAMTQALERYEGVFKVESDVIPDHLLIDHDRGVRTGEELARFVNGLATISGRCRAAVMQSCITATGRSLAVRPGGEP